MHDRPKSMLNGLWCCLALGLAWNTACVCGCIDVFLPELATDLGGLVFNDPNLASIEPVAEGPAFYSRQPVFEAIPGKIESHSPAITALPNGDLLAAWFSYEGPHELNGSAIYMSRLSAGENLWQEPWMHIDRPEGDGNPVLYSEGDRVFLFQAVVPGLWSTAHIETQISEDGGRTWSAPSMLPGPLGANVRFPPVRTAAGHLLLPAYDDLIQRALFYTSQDGAEWDLLGAVWTSPAAIQPSVAVLPDGRLLAVMRNTDGGWLWGMGSENAGLSWSAPRDSGFANPGSPAALLQLASGNLLLVYNDSPTDRLNFTAALSADHGATWPCRRTLTDADESCSYPAVCQSSDGLIHILFSAARQRIDHISCNEAWITQPEPTD